jgi:adhesin/invasin
MAAFRPPRLLAPLSALAVWACGGGDLTLPPQGPTAEVKMVQGDGQVCAPGARVPNPLIVRLVDASGVPIPNRTVLWVVRAGGGSISPTTGMTDAQGFASAEWTLGPEAGPNTVDAQVPDIGAVTFTAIGTTDGGGGGGTQPSAGRSTITADPASIAAGSGVATISVAVLDDSGLPVPGATVQLQATGTGNTLTQPTGPTGADGVAVGTLESSVPGDKAVSATVNGSLRLTQTVVVTVTPAQPSRVEPIEGAGQTAPAGEAVPVRPAVRVLDDQGQPVAGIQVSFVVTGGGGSASGANQTTNADGVARVGGWTLGTSPGTNTLEARAGSLQGSPVVFTAEGTGGGAAVDRLIFLSEPPSEVRKNQTFTVRVALVDAGGNVVPLSGIFIYLGLFRDGADTPSNDDLGGERFANTADGIAVLNLSVQREGSYRLRALTDDLPELGPHGPEPYLFSRLFEVE